MANRRGRRPSPRRLRLHIDEAALAAPPTARAEPQRGSIVPTVLWTVGAVIGIALLIALILVHVSQPQSGGGRWNFIGTAFLLTVITLGLVLKALQAFLNWKDPD